MTEENTLELIKLQQETIKLHQESLLILIAVMKDYGRRITKLEEELENAK